MEDFKSIVFKESKEYPGIPHILEEAKSWYESHKDSIENIHSSFTVKLETGDKIVYRRALVLRYREKVSPVE